MVVASLLPLVLLFTWSLTNHWPYPALLPRELTARGFNNILDPRSHIVDALLNSVVIATVVAALSCLVGLPAGRAIGMYDFPGRNLVRVLLLFPVIVPALGVALGLQVFFIHLGVADSISGVILVQLIPSVPYASLVYSGAFANFDVDFERQARSLGAGPLDTLRHVTLPMLRPTMIIAALFAFLISWTEYLLTLLIGGGAVTTLPLVLFALIGASDTTTAAAVSLIIVGPPMLAVFVTSRILLRHPRSSLGMARL